jgi:hypothetical protein
MYYNRFSLGTFTGQDHTNSLQLLIFLFILGGSPKTEGALDMVRLGWFGVMCYLSDTFPDFIKLKNASYLLPVFRPD